MSPVAVAGSESRIRSKDESLRAMPAAEEEVPADDTIRLLAKLKKKRLALAKSESEAAQCARGPPLRQNRGEAGSGFQVLGPASWRSGAGVSVSVVFEGDRGPIG